MTGKDALGQTALARFAAPLDGAKAAWFTALPWTIEAAPRKAFHLRRRLPRAEAVLLDEIAPDPASSITSLRVDVDQRDASTTWLDAGLPQPTFIIVDPRSGRAHLIWRLRRWVRRDNARASRFLERVQHAYTVLCRGDLAYNAQFHHNPLSATYETVCGPAAYDLRELALYLDEADLFRPTPRPRGAGFREEFAARGRNCHTFETVRFAAYKAVHECETFGAFYARVRALVDAENVRFERPLPECDSRSIAKSIARYVWTRRGGYSQPQRRYEMTREEYEGRAAERCAAALQMRAEGKPIADIARALGVARRTVHLYLSTGAGPIRSTVQSAPLSELGRNAPGDLAPCEDEPNTLRLRPVLFLQHPPLASPQRNGPQAVSSADAPARSDEQRRRVARSRSP